jgi:geranylgeranyl diphosphate synthase type II
MDQTLEALDHVIQSLCWVESTRVPSEKLLSAALSHHWTVKGSRLRPRLAIHAGLALGFPLSQNLRMAAACDFLHNASLIHDDLVDGSPLRRGQVALWQQFGIPVALAVGDLLISGAYAAISEMDATSDVSRLVQCIHQVTLKTIHGQLAPLDSMPMSLESYLEMSVAKTGALMAMPLVLPLLAMGLDHEAEIAARVGESFGVAYQIQDDLQDEAEDHDFEPGREIFNVVKILEAHGSKGAAHAEARRIGLEYLEKASVLSEQLPNGMGSFLLEEIRVLSDQLQELPS